MKQKDHLSNNVSVEARVTATGLSAKAKSRAIAAFDRLVGSIIDIPISMLESYANRTRAQGRLETSILDAATDRLAGETGSKTDAARLIDEVLASQLRLLANKGCVVQQAVEHLCLPGPEGTSEPDSDIEEVDPDWLNHFGRHAEMASSEKVRGLWAKVLAGEVRYPGSFSLTTLRLLAELDQQMAFWFEEEAKFRIRGEFILRPDDMAGERLERLVFLEQVGLVHHVAPIGGLGRNFTPDSNGIAALFEGDLCLRMHIDREVQLGIIPFTRVGKEIASILPPVDPMSILKRLASSLPDEVKSIDICRVLSEHQDHVRVSDPIEVVLIHRTVRGLV